MAGVLCCLLRLTTDRTVCNKPQTPAAGFRAEALKQLPMLFDIVEQRKRNAGGACPGGFVMKLTFGEVERNAKETLNLRFQRSQALIVQAIGRDKTW